MTAKILMAPHYLVMPGFGFTQSPQISKERKLRRCFAANVAGNKETRAVPQFLLTHPLLLKM
jgi:hypothetical protein